MESKIEKVTFKYANLQKICICKCCYPLNLFPLIYQFGLRPIKAKAQQKNKKIDPTKAQFICIYSIKSINMQNFAHMACKMEKGTTWLNALSISKCDPLYIDDLEINLVYLFYLGEKKTHCTYKFVLDLLYFTLIRIKWMKKTICFLFASIVKMTPSTSSSF